MKTSRITLALVAAVALASGRALAAPGGSGLEHDDTSYSGIQSTWGGAVALESLPPRPHDDTRYPGLHVTVLKAPLPPAQSLSLARTDDTVYPTADAPSERRPAPLERDERLACGCAHCCGQG